MHKVAGLLGLMLAVFLALIAMSQFGTFQSQGSTIAGPVGTFFAQLSGLWAFFVAFLAVVFAIAAVSIVWSRR